MAVIFNQFAYLLARLCSMNIGKGLLNEILKELVGSETYKGGSNDRFMRDFNKKQNYQNKFLLFSQ